MSNETIDFDFERMRQHVESDQLHKLTQAELLSCIVGFSSAARMKGAVDEDFVPTIKALADLFMAKEAIEADLLVPRTSRAVYALKQILDDEHLTGQHRAAFLAMIDVELMKEGE